MRLSLSRLWPAKALLIYVVIVTALFAMVVGAPYLMGRGSMVQGNGQPQAVPAMTQPKTDQNVKGGINRFLEGVLRLGLPLLDIYALPGNSPFNLNQSLSFLAWALGGVKPGQPSTVLQQQMPLFVMAEHAAGVWPGSVREAQALGTQQPQDGKAFSPGRNPLVIVYSTHSQESFEPVLSAMGKRGSKPYVKDADKSIVRVAGELARSLQEDYGIPVVHLPDFFDKNGLTGAYMESEQGVLKAMSQYPTARVLIDVHRDSAPRDATVTVINNEEAARVMFVVGQGNEHLPNPGWERNQEFASMVARKLDELYPPDAAPGEGGAYPPLVRKMDGDNDGSSWTFSRNGRFNQHLSPQAMLVEIGGPGNSMDEALRSARMVAQAVSEVLKGRVVVSPSR